MFSDEDLFSKEWWGTESKAFDGQKTQYIYPTQPPTVSQSLVVEWRAAVVEQVFLINTRGY